MRLAQRWALLAVLVLLGGCGTGAIFETEIQRQARIDDAVRIALDRERDRQALLVDQRTAPVVDGQQAIADRMVALERMAHAIATRLDQIERMTLAAEPPIARTAVQTTIEAEIDSIQRDLGALTGAVTNLAQTDDQDEAVVRARLERLELRTSRLAWPTPSSQVRAVHLASYRSHEAALAGWEVLTRRYRDVLGNEIPTLIEVRTVAGEFVRLFVGAGDDQSALLRIREALRDGGDYAMILPLPGNAGS
ncbi:MAG: hypothetical protein NXI18_04370 [Alphaproteobacteria bacterium]|nr:hypothetical protein [Alphaproteobacteria bacterium]